MLGSRSRNAWPARPRPVAARPILGPAPLRACHCVPSDVRVRADLIATGLTTNRAAALVIEIDSISQIGPSTPVAIEQPTSIVTKPLSETDQDDRVRIALGLTHDDSLPDVSYETLLAYHRYLAANLKFPIYATFWEESGPFSSKKVTATIAGLAEPQEDGIDEGYGLAGLGRTPNGEEIEFPLDHIELGMKDPNRRLLDDYSYWFHNWR